jgi:hypothetical protein
MAFPQQPDSERRQGGTDVAKAFLWGRVGVPFGGFSGLFREPRKREEHAGLLPISPVLLAVEADQIPLFELQGDEDVSGRRDGKQEMPEGHRRAGPEGEQEPEHEGVADIAIGSGGPERGRRVLLSRGVEVDLAKEPRQNKLTIFPRRVLTR